MRNACLAAALALSACATPPGHPAPESEVAQIGYAAAGLIPSCIGMIENPAGMDAEAERLGARPGKPAATGQRGWILPGPGDIAIIESGPERCLISIGNGRPAGLRLAVAETINAMEGAMPADASGLAGGEFPRVQLWGLCVGAKLYAVQLSTVNRERELPNGLIHVSLPRDLDGVEDNVSEFCV